MAGEYILPVIISIVITSLDLTYCKSPAHQPKHTKIRTTVFWIGEESSEDNGYIANVQSAWDGNWRNHYGGVDDPNNRNGYAPVGFIPGENPFYCALPYNDMNEAGKRKSTAAKVVWWSGSRKWSSQESMCKNHWVRIEYNHKVAYAQWEDVGPFGENDEVYVFGNKSPKARAGLDVSPAVRDYLGMGGSAYTQWEFVDQQEVLDGPWKKIITKSNIDF